MTDRAWTESAVFDRLRHIFPPPAHVLLPQVRNGTGCARRTTRTADAFVVSVWPSRGLWLAGVEIKCSRSDWKTELACPPKAQSIQRWCKYWYVASPPDVVPLAEVPETWGAIVVRSNTAEIVKSPPALEPIPPDMLLVCSILRTAAEYTAPVDSVQKRIDDAIAGAKKSWEKSRDYAMDELQERIQRFQEASGVALSKPWECGDIGAAVKFVRESGLLVATECAKNLRDNAMVCVERLDAALEKLQGDETGPGDGDCCTLR